MTESGQKITAKAILNQIPHQGLIDKVSRAIEYDEEGPWGKGKDAVKCLKKFRLLVKTKGDKLDPSWSTVPAVKKKRGGGYDGTTSTRGKKEDKKNPKGGQSEKRLEKRQWEKRVHARHATMLDLR